MTCSFIFYLDAVKLMYFKVRHNKSAIKMYLDACSSGAGSLQCHICDHKKLTALNDVSDVPSCLKTKTEFGRLVNCPNPALCNVVNAGRDLIIF